MTRISNSHPRDPVPSPVAASEAVGGLETSIANLLDGCIGIGAGESLLVVVEPEGETYYRDDVGAQVAAVARRRGLPVTLLAEPVSDGPETYPQTVLAAIAAADHTVFFSRLGSQARFITLPGPGTKAVCYALDAASFGSGFGSTPHAFVSELHDLLVRAIAAARTYRINCPNGTDISMELASGDLAASPALTPFSVRNFPVMIFPPMSSARASGRIALSLALLSTGIHRYDNSVLRLDTPLFLEIEEGEIVGFGGERAQAERARAHFERVGDLFGASPRAVNSWHAGINPGTSFAGDARADLSRWGGSAFGSPRYTHFHMVGADPGEICGSLFDATIRFDDEVFWDRGRLAFLDRPEIAALARRHGVSMDTFALSRPIGIAELS